MVFFRCLLLAGLLCVAGCNTPSSSPSCGPYEVADIILDMPWTEWKIVHGYPEAEITVENIHNGTDITVFANEEDLIRTAQMVAINRMMKSSLSSESKPLIPGTLLLGPDRADHSDDTHPLITRNDPDAYATALQNIQSEAGGRKLAAALTDREFLEQQSELIRNHFLDGRSTDVSVTQTVFSGHPALLIKGTLTLAGRPRFFEQITVFKVGLKCVRLIVDAVPDDKAALEGALACIKEKK